MDYTKEQVLKINRDFDEMNEFVYNKIKEICEKTKFFDKYWVYDSHEICEQENVVYVVAYDHCYDQYDTRNTTIPLDWLFNENWEEEWKKLEKERIKKENALKKQREKEKEEAEYKEYLRLSEKFKK